MKKGHNQGSNDMHRSKEDVKEVPGQDSHLKNKASEKISKSRNAEDDQSGGTKGQNAIS
ncbi:hypothetical protein [Telluribacter humicola]|uniref:hypothetical protein n=1 Tax=Telluribacter humicola TaxID=1720261 RepID=UPI001A96B6B6|nr:hypothetical protein [Telluribacter humicola]